MEALAAPHKWLSTAMQRISAVDGKTLAWPRLVSDKLFTIAAYKAAEWAERQKLATINLEDPEEGETHLTLGACGCALSHRQAWQALVDGEAQWALILEDDLVAICEDFDARLSSVLGKLQRGWRVCYLGFHTPEGTGMKMLPPREEIRELYHFDKDEGWLAGLWCHLVSRAGAELLLGGAVPFSVQADALLGKLAVESGGCYCLRPGQFLAYSHPTEVSRDTDIQTFPGEV